MGDKHDTQPRSIQNIKAEFTLRRLFFHMTRDLLTLNVNL